ncbi:MAG TPA: winged helix-turn-helix domain-containing protein [Burkholderiaceae bacterium]|nr:winged helix-turn-helix domain-containing protein [Burkholderiaceae bacterium]
MTLTTLEGTAVELEHPVRAPTRPAATPLTSRPTRGRVLVVTDAPGELRNEVAALNEAGMMCLQVESDPSAVRRAAQWAPDVALILGAAMPLDRRVEWLYALRSEGTALVVMVFGDATELGGDEERFALEVGFDAVWRQLGSPALLCSRLQALLRPRQRTAVRRVDSGIALGDLTIDGDLPLARRRGRVVPLTSRQVRVLHTMATAPSRTLSRAALISMRINGEGGALSDGHSRAVDVFVSRLRRRLRQLDIGGFDLVAVRGVGYRLIVTAEE